MGNWLAWGAREKKHDILIVGKRVRNAVQSAWELHQGNCKVVSDCNKEQGL